MASVSMTWVRDGLEWGGRPEWVLDDHSVCGMDSVGVKLPLWM